MNYAIVAFGIMLLIAGLTWVFDGRKNYEGPHMDVQALLEGKVEGMEPIKASGSAGKTEEEMVESKTTVPIDGPTA